tara:strand:+ start:260 stop:1066 length:807 start_codon:yes stop_codon:yes gene_type:complete
MLKFYRRIRFDLLERSKTGKYFKYAIGEIVLVVIGILIALSLNTWNTNRLNRIEEVQLLKQLKIELLQNQEKLTAKEKLRTRTIKSSLRVLALIDDPSIIKDPDEIDHHLANMIPNYTFDPSEGIIAQLLEGGKLSLIQNDRLRYDLSKWSSMLAELAEEEQDFKTHNFQTLRPILFKNYAFRNILNKTWDDSVLNSVLLSDDIKDFDGFGKSPLKIDLDKLFTSHEFEGAITSLSSFNIVINIQSQGVNNYISEMLKIINSELAANP